MQLLHPNASAQHNINYGIYTTVRLEANPLTLSMALPIRNAIKTLKNTHTDVQDKGEETSASLALRDARDNDADNAVISLSLELLSAVVNNRANPRYKNIFLKKPSEITEQSIADELNDLKLLEERLKADATDTVYQKHLPIIKAARTALGNAQQTLDNSITAEKNSADLETIAQNDLRTLLTKTYGKLIDMFNKKEAEKHFKKQQAKKKTPVV